ncbi:hypothetical protein RAZWK3B_09721 [Roseobacter sp. AzwK-3b]|nr:hypothetical protein RAZWK3B_09721 [Roseobacter sp. AzwK-3b]
MGFDQDPLALLVVHPFVTLNAMIFAFECSGIDQFLFF